MSMDTLRETIALIDTLSPEERPLKIVFHGGEPLLAGPSFYEKALPLLRQRFGARLRLSMQSNLSTFHFLHIYMQLGNHDKHKSVHLN